MGVKRWAALRVKATNYKLVQKAVAGTWAQASASQLQTADDCMRKWYIDKILKVREPQTRAMRVGERVHQAIEDFVGEGKPLRDPLAIPAKSFLFQLYLRARRKKDVYVERRFSRTYADIEIQGLIDVHVGQDTIIDHKTTSAKKWVKTPGELRQNIQAHTYAWAVFSEYPEVDKVNITYNYLIKKPTPHQKLVRTYITRDENNGFMQQKIFSLLQQMKTYAKSDAPEHVPMTHSACSKFGGCPYRDFCHERKARDARTQSRSDLLGDSNETKNRKHRWV